MNEQIQLLVIDVDIGAIFGRNIGLEMLSKGNHGVLGFGFVVANRGGLCQCENPSLGVSFQMQITIPKILEVWGLRLCPSNSDR